MITGDITIVEEHDEDIIYDYFTYYPRANSITVIDDDGVVKMELLKENNYDDKFEGMDILPSNYKKSARSIEI